MDIIKTKINNYRSIKDVEFSFDTTLNIFVGINGSGKTTILDSLITSLSWLINRIQRENISGKHIPENDIKNNKSYSAIKIFVNAENKVFNWKLAKTRKGETAQEKSELSGISQLADSFRNQLREKGNLPVIAYYPVNRVVKDISPVIPSRDNFHVLDVYENTIAVKANYQAFFEWFRLQDDILNEKLGSRAKWMKKNKTWIKEKVFEIIELLQNISIGGEVDTFEIEHINRRIQENEIFVENPSYLFQEILFMLKSIKQTANNKSSNIMFLEDISLAIKDIDKIITLLNSNRYNYTDLESLIGNIVDKYNIIAFENLFMAIVKFVLLLELWWITDVSKNKLENIFKNYNDQLKNKQKKWFNSSFKEIEQIVENDTIHNNNLTRNGGREIQIVANTIENFIEGYSNLRIKRVPRPHMLVNKNGETFNLEQLSDGEKNLIALVGDIARRLSIANPNSKEPLKGDGIILIDEVDLHLHPSWQRLIIPKLTELFPNCQFFITTHSPQVLSHVKPDNIFLLKNNNNELSYAKPTESYGKNTDRILEDILGVDARPQKEKNALRVIYDLIQKNDIENAKKNIGKLESLIGEDSELVKARVLIKRKEIIGK